MFDNKIDPAGKPEDIFGQVDAAKNSQSAGIAPSPVASGNTPNEPVIKNTPSAFNPKNFTVESSTMPAVPPQVSKNIIFLGAIIIFALGGLAFGAWWFFFRGPSVEIVPGQIANQAVEDLYKKTSEQKDNTVNNQDNTGDKQTELADNTELIGDIPATPLDSDQDGLSDEEELMINTDLAKADTDEDGLFDREEVKIYNTDPLKKDTDGDSYGDKEEIINNTDPLKAEAVSAENSGIYKNTLGKFSFQPLEGMVLETDQSDFVYFNDNANQIKLYVYINQDNLDQLLPDILYYISENNENNLVIDNYVSQDDQTPVSTEYNTNAYRSSNGYLYIVKYVATKRASDHQEKFENILSSFKFLL